jgi:SecY interacting protein Syd
VVQQPLHAYYTTQFAGDMQARFADETMTLLQTWSGRFPAVQENLIGHLLVQKRLKLRPRCLSPRWTANWMSFRSVI